MILHGRFGHAPPQIAVILERNGFNDVADQTRNRTYLAGEYPGGATDPGVRLRTERLRHRA